MAGHGKPAGGSFNGRSTVEKIFDMSNNQATSPSSERSGYTLHKNESPDARSNGTGALSESNAIRPNDLGFKNLSIHSSGSQIQSRNDHHTSPFHRGPRNNNDVDSGSAPLRGSVRRDVNFRAGTPCTSINGPGNYRNSCTWTSPDQQAQQEFQGVRIAMRRLFRHSDVSNWKLADYITHREAMITSQAKVLTNQVKEKEEARWLYSPSIQPETQCDFKRWGLQGNFNERGNFGRVLGEQTIWCQDWQNGKDYIAPWPSMAEMKWEGDDRAKTGVGRFLPLPRENGFLTPQWKTSQWKTQWKTPEWSEFPVITQYPIDQVARIPTMEDIYLPVDDQIEPEKEYLWSQKLEKDMDALLES